MSSRGIWEIGIHSFTHSFIQQNISPDSCSNKPLLGMFVMENQPGTRPQGAIRLERETDKESQTRGGSVDGA